MCALASGSSGNCFYIGSREIGKGILIDAGISSKQICLRLNERGLSPENVLGVFLTHEHVDHIRGADVFARSFGVPIFATRGTFNERFICSDNELLNAIGSGSMKFGGFSVKTFMKSHRASEPVSFLIGHKGKKVGVITDVGVACENVLKAISDCDFLCLESNHDLSMLENGRYPYFLKKWISGEDGHLSNLDAALSVAKHGNGRLKGVVLSHLSENNNTPEVALDTWEKVLDKDIDLWVSTRDVGELIRI